MKIVTLLLWCVLPATAWGQLVDRPSHGVATPVSEDSAHKNPVVAGVASFLLPGVGSWYADDGRHAAVHGGIALGIAVAGWAMFGGGCPEFPCRGEHTVGPALILLAGVTNEIWSTVTAVDDARRFNERVERRRTGRVDVVPALQLAGPAGDRRRLGVRLLRLVY